MPSERRLHPFSVLFAFLTQIRAFVVPGILVLIGARSRGGDWWQPWMMLLIIPSVIAALLRYLTFRYSYEPNEMVIRSGLLFRKERHIPYARIQNVDAVQRVLHRALNVVEVRVQTGGGTEPEATLSVLPVAAFEEMRQRVLDERHRGPLAVSPGLASGRSEQAEAPAAHATQLLALPIRELLICGFIENRGAVLIAAAFGALWELGPFDRAMESFLGDETPRTLIRNLVSSITRSAAIPWDRIQLIVAIIVGLLLFIRLLSMVWAVVRLYGFRLALVEDDFRLEYGLLTRVAATIPRRRIQKLTVRESPLHRVFRRVSVRVETAGGKAAEGSSSVEREWLAPVLARDALAPLVGEVLGRIDLMAVEWRRVAPRAFRREVKRWLVLAAFPLVLASFATYWFALVLVPFLLTWAIVGARQTIKHLRWAVTDDAVLFRRGWLWRHMTIVKFAKMQTVTLAQSPFDRRTVMARVRVDTAGASATSSRVNIPYLPHQTAGALFADLSAEAARTEFKW